MKVTHSNQTLILASDRRGQDVKTDSPLDEAVNAAAKGGTLRRVTIVASQPSSVVYVHADYADLSAEGLAAADADSPSGNPDGRPLLTSPGASAHATAAALPVARNTLPASLTPVAGDADRDTFGNRQTGTRVGGLSAYLRPTEQYARTQRLEGSATPSSLIDVHA